MKISVIGAGAMGGSLAKGLLTYVMPQAAADLCVADAQAASLEYFAKAGAQTTTNNAKAVKDADLVFVVVKPWIVQDVLQEIKDELDYQKQTLVIIAAGVKSIQLKEWLAKDELTSLPHTYLAIPNIAIAVGNSMTIIAPVNPTKELTTEICNLFNQMGQSIVVEEKLLGAGTTLASCGIAYAMRYIRASVEGAVELGFRAKDAQQIVEQTVKGAVELLQATHAHPEAKIDEVTTPGGVTIKGLNEMEHAGFSSAVIRGLKAGAK